MTSRTKISRQALFAFIALWIAGCAGTPPDPTPPKRAADSAAQADIYAVGYRSISEKYIDPISVAEIAVGGMQGFAAIDPALRVERAGDLVRLTMDGRGISEFKAPGDDDSNAWAGLTVSFEQAGRDHSALMKKASAEKRYEAVFDGMLANLDVFSRYAGADEARRNRARRDGFGGIGIRFKIKNDKPIITMVMPGTPAANVELKAGDEITHIDGEALLKPKVHDVVAKLRGPTHSEVKVRVYRARADRSIDVIMERLHIVPPTVKASLENGLVVLKISSFNQATARSVAKELEAAKEQAGDGLRGLIIDLRGNPGGLLKQSVKVADLLLTHGHIVSTRGRHPDSLHHYEAGGRDLAGGLPTVVLVDGKSASASEIVAAAMQDRGRAVLIGTSSFGKGTVQTVIRLPNDGEVTLTWSRLVAPSGYALHGLGVRPAICTSGGTHDLKAFLRRSVAERLKARSSFSSWRTVGIGEKEARRELRESCPSERRDTELELKLARMLLDNQPLYAQAIELSATTNQAHK